MTIENQTGFTREIISLPSPGPGTHRKLHVHRFGNPGSRPKLYIQTGLHADEIPGMLVLHHLQALLIEAERDKRITGEIVLVPVANPIGMAQRMQENLIGRLDFVDGRNFNRYYPDLAPDVIDILGDSLGQDSEANDKLIRDALVAAADALPEESENQAMRKYLLRLSADADICIDVHCDTEANLYMYSDNNNIVLADELCALMGCDVHIRDESLSYCFDGTVSLAWNEIATHFADNPIIIGCMGITLEMRGTRDIDDELAQQDAHNLFQFFINAGIVEGEKAESLKPLCDATPLEGVEYVSSPKTGVVVFNKQCGDEVSPGEVVAVLVDPLQDPNSGRTDILCTTSGTIYNRTDQRLVYPGHIILSIAGKDPIPGKRKGELLSD